MLDRIYNRRFFASQLGVSALISVAAMVAFNLFAISHASAHDTARHNTAISAPAISVMAVELA